jgi:hypothetical protein
VVAAKGSPELAEKYYALKDSVSKPFRNIRKRIRYAPSCFHVAKAVSTFSPAIRLVDPESKADVCHTKESG